MIQSTSEMLRDQTGKINEQAASSTVDIAKLQVAFDNVFATLDAIDTFKVGALQSMKTTVGELQTQVDGAKTYLDRAQKEGSQTAQFATNDADSALALPAST
jgi:uncharacterized protein YaaN involved in tellurite resistance